MASFYENDTSEYFQSGHLDGARIDLRFDISVYRNESCNKTEYVFGRTEGILAGVFASLLSISGITANIITISALLNFQKTRNHVTTLFIVSLATSDLVFSMFTLPTLSTRFFTGDWIFGQETDFWCQLFPLFFYGNSAVSLFNLMTVTINRAVMIYYPSFSEKLFTRFKSKLIIVFFCWLVPMIMLLPSLFRFYGQHGMNCKSRSCTILRDENGKSPKNFFLASGLMVPGIVLVIANALIYYKVHDTRKQSERQLRGSSTVMPKGLKKKEQQLTKMMCIIFGCFIVTYMPGVFVKLVDRGINHPIMHVLSYILNWSSVVLNPLIYVATQERYRQAVRYLIQGFAPAAKRTQSFALNRQKQDSAFRSSVSEDHQMS